MSKKDEILKVARELFSQFGIKKVTTDDIARAAHVSKATIYKYYRNKGEIFDDVVSLEANELLSAIRSAVDAEPSAVGKFKAHIVTRMLRVRELVNFYRVTRESWRDFWPHLAKLDSWFLDEEKKIVMQTIEEGVQEGELEVPRLNLCAHITVAALRSVEFPWALAPNDVSATDYADMMIDMMYNGIRKR